MQHVDYLIARLEGVRETGPGKWIARCPAHDDRRPSLSIRVAEAGAILLHCFAGCGAADVLAAIGLEFGDLYPANSEHGGPQRPNHWHAARDALRALEFEALLVAVAAENIAYGVPLSVADRDRLLEAASRIRAAARACL